MNITQLLSQFSTSINWNAFAYTIYKLLFTTLTFVLYSYLSPQDFSTWANINSIIFLLLLWLDFGFRKSVPLFLPAFASNYNATIHFLRTIIFAKLTILLLGLPLLYYFISMVVCTLQLNNGCPWFIIATLIILFQGLKDLFKLIFHAHFWNKQFNLMATSIMILEVTANFTMIFLGHHILIALFITKIIAGASMVLISIIMLIYNYKSITKQNNSLSVDHLYKAFIKHTTLMWVNTSIKSLTERNFLMPLLTYKIGPVAANMFKIANDGGLLFYRIVIKTIGTNDTALLAHIQIKKERKELLPIAFKKLTRRVAALCLPLLGIIGLLFFNRTGFILYNPLIFNIFLIITIGFLLEAFFSPFERVLEVKKRYFLLFFAYIPYLIMVIYLLFGNSIALIGLFGIILVIHSVRLVSSLLMTGITHYIYKLTLPFLYIFLLTVFCVVCVLVVHYSFTGSSSWVADLIALLSAKLFSAPQLVKG